MTLVITESSWLIKMESTVNMEYHGLNHYLREIRFWGEGGTFFVWGEHSQEARMQRTTSVTHSANTSVSPQTIQGYRSSCPRSQQSWLKKNFKTHYLPQKTEPSSFCMAPLSQVICCLFCIFCQHNVDQKHADMYRPLAV